MPAMIAKTHRLQRIRIISNGISKNQRIMLHIIISQEVSYCQQGYAKAIQACLVWPLESSHPDTILQP